MYRGSTDLLFRDYKVLAPAVDYLKNQAAKNWEDCAFSNEDSGRLAERLIELSTGLSGKLKPKLKRSDIAGHVPNPTDTLLSKILLNTLACVPAFDIEVKTALSETLDDYTPGNAFRLPVIRACIELARHNRGLLLGGQKLLHEKAKVCYPLTKVLDLYLWIYGREVNAKAKAAKAEAKTKVLA